MGGTTEPIANALKESYAENASLTDAWVSRSLHCGPAVPTPRVVINPPLAWPA